VGLAQSALSRQRAKRDCGIALPGSSFAAPAARSFGGASISGPKAAVPQWFREWHKPLAARIFPGTAVADNVDKGIERRRAALLL
jgi:hypothetical protein